MQIKSSSQLVVAENFSHVFVQPFHLVTGREGKILDLLLFEAVDLIALVKNPLF